MKRPARHHARWHQRAFTLIELLVAVALLLLLVTLLTNMIGQTASSIRPAESRIETSDTARTVLDRMGRDLQLLVTGGGATVIVGSNSVGGTSNDFMAFLSRIRGPNSAGDARLTSLLYAIRSYSDKVLDVNNVPMLGREYLTVSWDIGASTLPEDALAIAANSVNSAPAKPAAFTDQILRMAISVQTLDGNFVPVSQAPRSTTFTSTPALSASCYALDLSKVKAIVVAVAALDLSTRTKVSSTFSDISRALPVPELGKTPMDTWQAAVNGGALNSLSAPARENIRFYQRIFPLK